MRLFILTGASRGLGRAMASQLLAADLLLLTIERTPDASLPREARAAGAQIEQWALDVAHDLGVAARLEAWLHQQAGQRFASVTLINNAGVIGTVGPVDLAPADEIATVLRVGLEAPMNLTAAFLRATVDWPCERRILNISSGAGRSPIAGWAPYCAAKAGLDHFSRVTALDEARRPNGAKIVALAPGVIDTSMQSQLRAADAAGFPDKQRFLDLHAQSQLASPDAAATKVLAYLARADYGKNPVADVRDA
ncbi:MAG: SDR family NAD(P)-dependent oxidoreductase [Burkholderiaceae bacterium]|nr:SDR family NAD(P)-dependent oxidoreductase [Burkholderiaceae bacterium]